MAKVTGPSWAGSSIYIFFNKNRDLGEKQNSQEWSQPRLLLDKPGYFLWYPSLQPVNTPVDIRNKNTCLRLGQRARLFIKNIRPEKSEYLSEYIIEFNSSAMDEQEIKQRKCKLPRRPIYYLPPPCPLMEIPDLSPEIVKSVQGVVEWFYSQLKNFMFATGMASNCI